MRKAFTLVELLMVISFILALAGLALLITPRFAESQRVTRGADLVQGWLLGAKQRAYRDQSPRGLRLVRDAGNPNWVKELVWIERPEDLRGDPDPAGLNNHNRMQVPSPVRVPNVVGVPPNSYVFLPGWDVVSGDVVQRGDWLKMNGLEDQPYNLHRIQDVTLVNGGTVLRLAAADGTPSPVTAARINGQQIVGPNADTRFQIIRGTRPMSGEPVLQLPRDVVIDLDPATVGTSILTGQAPLDVMFDGRGQLVGADGKVVLRMRNSDRAANDGDQVFIVIEARTGLMRAVPVGDSGDPYQYVRKSNDGGM